MRDTQTRKADALAALEQQADLWLSTADPDGRPHLIPVSAWWDGTNLVIATAGASRTARNMKAMKKDDLGFFYHTGEEKRIVGIVEVIGEYRPDPTDETQRFGLVNVKAVKDVPKPVTLADAKRDPKLKDMVLAKYSRLSVQPVTPEQWKHICKLGGVKDS